LLFSSGLHDILQIPSLLAYITKKACVVYKNAVYLHPLRPQGQKDERKREVKELEKAGLTG
jgi:hypothetical protein